MSRFRLLGHSMGGMVARRIVLDHPDRVEALVLMDTAPGPVPGFDADLMEFGAAEWRAEQGKDVLKALLDEAAPLHTPAYERMLAERPEYQAFQDRKWDALSEVMWAAMVVAIARQDDDLPEFHVITCPTLVMVGETGHAVPGPVAGDGRRDPARRARRDPGRRSFTAVRERPTRGSTHCSRSSVRSS